MGLLSHYHTFWTITCEIEIILSYCKMQKYLPYLLFAHSWKTSVLTDFEFAQLQYRQYISIWECLFTLVLNLPTWSIIEIKTRANKSRSIVNSNTREIRVCIHFISMPYANTWLLSKWLIAVSRFKAVNCVLPR